MNKLIKMLVCALFAFACSSGTGSIDNTTGVVQLNVTTAPTSVQCLRVTATNSVRTVVKDIDVVSGVADPSPLEGLPTGDVTIGAKAYDAACSSVVPTMVPTWLSYPITQVVQLVEGVPFELEFVLRPNGDIVPSTDWQSDTLTTCNFTYDGNNDACSGVGCDPCKLFSGTVVTYCQQTVDCNKNKSCVTQQNLFCENVTNECTTYVNNFLQSANSSQLAIISTFVTLSCGW